MNFERLGLYISPQTFNLLSKMLAAAPARPYVDECLAHPALAFDVDALHRNPSLLFAPVPRPLAQSQNQPQITAKAFVPPKQAPLVPLQLHLPNVFNVPAQFVQYPMALAPGTQMLVPFGFAHQRHLP